MSTKIEEITVDIQSCRVCGCTEIKPDMVVFPRIPGSAACGAVIVSVGIHGAIRGKNRTMPDGSVARPDAIILDDVSTKKDAASKIGTGKIIGITFLYSLSRPMCFLRGMSVVPNWFFAILA